MDKKKTPAPAKQSGPREVVVQWDNVWTSKGKAFHGEKITLDAAEIKALGAAVK